MDKQNDSTIGNDPGHPVVDVDVDPRSLPAGV
jgi:hypothetical protein